MAVDYLDADVAYFLGLVVARGELSERENTFTVTVHFPKGALLASGEALKFDTDKEIRLGIVKVRERLLELTGADIRTVEYDASWDLVIRWTRNTMAWRNMLLILGNQKSHEYFHVPLILLDENTPREYKSEFIRGYADVNGNIRPSNRDQAGRHRVRLDILNHPFNWKVPVQLCLLLQEHLDVPVQLVTWGHPNLGREWREHQLYIYAEDLTSVGFCFDYKQQALQELADKNLSRFTSRVRGCPGARRPGVRKPRNIEENNSTRLDAGLVGKHFDAYWHICRALDCPRRPAPGEQLELVLEDADDRG